MYSDVFCKVYNEFGWNYYPEAFGGQLLDWLVQNDLHPKTALDLACGTGILCQILHQQGIDVTGMDLSEGMIAAARERNPGICYQVADMVRFRPRKEFDLVTCTGDALNHILDLRDVQTIFENIHSYLAPGGYLVFDLLRESEVSSGEPFEMDFDDHTRVWFQMTRPGENAVNLEIRVYEEGVMQFAENIRETLHHPDIICQLLKDCGFRQVLCSDRLLPGQNRSSTWYITAQK